MLFPAEIDVHWWHPNIHILIIITKEHTLELVFDAGQLDSEIDPPFECLPLEDLILRITGAWIRERPEFDLNYGYARAFSLE